MKMKNIYPLLAILLLPLSHATATDHETTKNGVIIRLKQKRPEDVQSIRLQVINEKIIHVSATPERTFSAKPSLISVFDTGKHHPDFTVKEEKESIILSTRSLHARISLNTGEIGFTDPAGNPILNENEGGGKTFRAIEVENTKGYELRQVFESSDDEAFYGLGQHQADEFNYKGKNEELFQYNTKVAVPFVLSNKNYGILWDNYSLSRFGDPRDYAQLNEAFRLYDKEGREGGLTGTYIPHPQRGKDTLVRTEPFLYFENLKANREYLPEGFPLMGANVTFEGELEASESGLHRFLLYYAGYVKVYLDNELLVPERWRTAWNPNSYKFTANLPTGKRIPLRIEWKPDGGESYCGLRVLTPVTDKEQNKLSLFSEMGNEIDYYFIYGNSMDEVISGYRTLTGKAQIMPKWAMGFWQSREKYNTRRELLDVLCEFRRRRIPLDNIVIDWNHWPENAWGSHEFDLKRFPDPKGMVDSIHALNAKIMISVWPKFYTNTEHFKEFEEKGWMYMQSVRDSLRDWVGPGYRYGFYDAYDPEARKLFWKQMQDHYCPLGIDAWWMDASEPNVRDCTDMQYRKALCGPTALGPSTQYFNAYALMNAEAIYDGQRKMDPDRQVFLLTRSGFAGLQRYSTATWSGDIATRWEDMKAQISAGLNFAMSGIPYWTMDIGGFCVERRYEKAQREWNRTKKENADYKEWRELNARWYQFGAFCPLYRSHGQFPYREIWNIAPEGHPAYQSMVYYTRLRYRMMPYIYSLAGMTHFNDYTIMRALVMDFGKDKNVLDISDQFMFGPALMACPVYTYKARQRKVYFPDGNGWYDFYTGKHITGGQTLTVDAPYEQIPLYVRSGAILPYGPDLQYTGEKTASEIILYVYTGQDGAFTLYEDENENYNYEKGQYSMIPFKYDEATRSLTIGKRQGEFSGMLKERTFRIVTVSPTQMQAFDPDASGKTITYNGGKQTIRL